MWLLLVLALALLPGGSQCTAGAGAPRWIQQKEWEVPGQQQRSRAPCVSTGCRAVTGPGTVRGFLGGSLSVTCTYRSGLEELPKFWCVPSRKFGFICDNDIVITSESKPAVLRGRFSIRDNRTRRAFTVTVHGLSEEDVGTFRCGVRTPRLVPDVSAAVKVIVLSARVTPTSRAWGQTAGGGFTPSVTGTRCPSGSRCTHPSSASAAPTLSPDAPPGSRGTFRYFPVLAGLQLLALLAMSAAVLWVSLRLR
ncbi:CMRF35-like molecule 6 [Onychostruthus taczanowskii]|uniref:CMRF35-like molecule 6 n=1 Tax=Onychostruthus taczanowskii TaxID=356909 RepID=UPI001B804D41|nr:CMRF35-like molecule 6 [Onychostruthus taczanowskii]